MSLEKLIRLADSLVEFEASLNANELPLTTSAFLDIHREEVKSIWQRLKQVYEQCLADLANEVEQEDEEEGDEEGKQASVAETVKDKYKRSYSTYCADILPSIMLPKCTNNICGSLMAHETVFGWILTGPVPSENTSCFSNVISLFNEISLDERISKFWEVENVPRKRVISSADKFCEELYKSTTYRDKGGRYVVCLPFKEEFPKSLCLGRSRSISMAQFFRSENRLLRNPSLKEEYDKNILEYLSLNHMFSIREFQSNSSSSSQCYYLPHHAVLKPDSTTTKVRVVFNASSPTSNGISLNDVLYTGPVLQNDLTILILNWRFYQFVFNGDIQKMYRQILVNPIHTPFQRILYRKDPNEPIKDYELRTVTFGLNCAPYLAIRTILQLADDIQQKYPLASQVLKTSMYVDDALVGAHDIHSAIETRKQLVEALRSAGFIMRKWTSNTKKILKGIPGEDLLHADFLNFDEHSAAKTLGIRWNALDDEFYFSTCNLPDAESYSKREVFSQISKLFDPAGWLAPIIIMAKIIMQKIWMDQTSWDAEIKPDSLQLWKTFKYHYPGIEKIRIPRWINFVPGGEVQFHCFSDASEKAYAAVIYIRIIYPDSICTHLVSSKTRVAPIKTLSIPRFELCGATLLAEMIDALIPQLNVSNYSLFCWTDSSIVLSWLAKPPCHWNMFVANRVSKIIEVADPTKWFHVESEYNPADLASRGVYPHDLLDRDLWWKGPSWLAEPSEHWPEIHQKVRIQDTELEQKHIKVHFAYFEKFEDILENFSSFPKALRVISYIYRFFLATHPKYRSNYQRTDNTITASEIQFVRKKLISTTQKAFYPNEYSSLNSKRAILSSSALLNLNPFLDNDGVMRAYGRLERSSILSLDERHPIILPYQCQYSRLLVSFIHLLSLHGGNQLVLRLIRLQYWIPKDPSDLAALTPGHFLIGSPILTPLDPEANYAQISIQNRWQRLKSIHQHFCSRWKNEYLKELQKRNKWKQPETDLKKDAIVVIREENLPPNSWRLGKITKVYYGSDRKKYEP
ncbi:uncharacterized protein [Musca autumnalis]|uniref:uncharacterized protein n=1 Tax=Musca autumnalis TaxID=221902 RepID=UPI003CF00B91